MVAPFNTIFFTLSTFLILAVVQPAYAETLSARVQPVVVNINEEVTLTISLDSENSDIPDLSVLKKIFRIKKQTNSLSVSQESGGTSIRKNWIITLLPLKTGKLTIPPIAVGTKLTLPITVNVRGNGNVNKAVKLSKTQQKEVDGLNKDVFVDIETDRQKTYVEGQLILTQKIYHAVPLASANLSPPSIKDDAAVIVPLAKETPYFWHVKGRRYHVIERSFALFPKRSGTMYVKEAKFTGIIKEKTAVKAVNQHGDNKQPGRLKQQKSIKATTPSLSFEVKPQPANSKSTRWLPAKNITLYANWQTALDSLEMGEPISLQLGIIADGLRAEQLPDIKLEIPAGVKTYYEQPKLDNTLTVTGVTGTWSQKVTLIPVRLGNIHISSLKLNWWNVTTDRLETAVLTEKVLQVKAGLGNNSSKKEMLLSSDNTETSVGSELVSDNKEKVSTTWLSFYQKKQWFLLLSFLLVAGLLFLKFRNNTSDNQGDSASREDHRQFILDSLKFACLENNPKKVQQLLPQWANRIAKIRPATLKGIEVANQGYMRHEMKELNRALYSKSPSNWKGVSLWDAIKKYPYQEQVLVKKQGNKLQDMYPK